MADINKLKDKIKSTIYPNGKGAINASDHQAMLLDMADGMAETDTKLAKLSDVMVEMTNDSLEDAHLAEGGHVYYIPQVENCQNTPDGAGAGFVISLGYNKQLPYNNILIYVEMTNTRRVWSCIRLSIAEGFTSWKRLDADTYKSEVSKFSKLGLSIAQSEDMASLADANNAEVGYIYVKNSRVSWDNIPEPTNDVGTLFTFGSYRNSPSTQLYISQLSNKMYIRRCLGVMNQYDSWEMIGGNGGTSVDVVQEIGNSETSVMSQKAVTEALKSFNQSAITSINLVDSNNLVHGQIISSTGEVTDHSVYLTSPFIACEPSTSYKYSCFNDNGSVVAGYIEKVAFYDSDKSFIGLFSMQSDMVYRDFLTPSNAAYFRVQGFRNGTKWMVTKAALYKGHCGYASIQQREIEDYAYIPFGEIPSVSILTSKYLIDFGDSIMRGDGTNGKGIGYLIASRNQMAFTQFSQGGATLSSSSALNYTYDRQYKGDKNYYSTSKTLLVEGTDYNVGDKLSTAIYQENTISSQLDEAFDRGIFPDYILINGLTNDLNYSEIGEIEDGYEGGYNKLTLAGGLEDALYRIRNKWSNAKILFVLPHKMPSSANVPIDSFVKMVKDVCKKWSIKYVDMYNYGGLNTRIPTLRTQYTFSSDGIHPNMKGYESFYIEMIESALANL